MKTFRVGDKVRRKRECQGGVWPYEDTVFSVVEASHDSIRLNPPSYDTSGWWTSEWFDLVEKRPKKSPAKALEEKLAKGTAELSEAKELLQHAVQFWFDNGWCAYKHPVGWAAWAYRPDFPGERTFCFNTRDEAIAKCREAK